MQASGQCRGGEAGLPQLWWLKFYIGESQITQHNSHLVCIGKLSKKRSKHTETMPTVGSGRANKARLEPLEIKKKSTPQRSWISQTIEHVWAKRLRTRILDQYRVLLATNSRSLFRFISGQHEWTFINVTLRKHPKIPNRMSLSNLVGTSTPEATTCSPSEHILDILQPRTNKLFLLLEISF